MVNSSFKRFIREIIPPFYLRHLMSMAGLGIRLKGNYLSWSEARKNSTGYDADAILNKVRDSLLKVKSGVAAYERDSVLFDKVQYSFPVIAGLLRIAVANEGKLSVLDFGGSLGSSYYQCRGFFPDLKQLRWSIIEQKKFVDCGKELFENDELKFYYNIDDCLNYEKPDVVLLSSVIQYLEEPYALLDTIIENGFSYIIFDITPFYSGKDDIITVQHVPKDIYLASYPFRIFSLDKFMNLFSGKYNMLADFDSLDLPALRQFKARYSGLIFKRI